MIRSDPFVIFSGPRTKVCVYFQFNMLMESPGNIWIINIKVRPSYSDKSQHVTSHFVGIFPQNEMFLYSLKFSCYSLVWNVENVLIPSICYIKGKLFLPRLPFSKMFLIPIIVPIYLVVWPRNPNNNYNWTTKK